MENTIYFTVVFVYLNLVHHQIQSILIIALMTILILLRFFILISFSNQVFITNIAFNQLKDPEPELIQPHNQPNTKFRNFIPLIPNLSLLYLMFGIK